MSAWSYMPGEDVGGYYEYPEDFEFGLGEDDDAIFEAAWIAMEAHPHCVTVRMSMRFADNDRLTEMGAILFRQPMLDAEKLRRQEIEVAIRTMVHRDQEVMFPGKASACVAAMMFSGRIVE